jgi:hypothetical protein
MAGQYLMPHNYHLVLHFWYTLIKLQSPLSSMDMHLIHLSNTSLDYAQRHKLCPFQKWLNLTHLDTFIHSPLEFASVNGQKLWDPVSQADWDVLKSYLNMFHNPLPWFDVPSYSIHIDHGVHVSFHNAAISRQLVLSTSHAGSTPGTLTSLWQKVMASQAYCPPPFYIHIPLQRCLFGGMTCWDGPIGHPLC